MFSSSSSSSRMSYAFAVSKGLLPQFEKPLNVPFRRSYVSSDDNSVISAAKAVTPKLERQTNGIVNSISPGVVVNLTHIPDMIAPGLGGLSVSTQPRSYPPKQVRKESVKDQQLSLCLPKVPITFKSTDLNTSLLAKYGNIKLIDLNLRFDENNAPYFMCFVHFNRWSTSLEARTELDNIRNPNIRVFYPGIGAVFENTSVDRFLTLSGFDSYHTAEIDNYFEMFWNQCEQDRLADEHFWEILHDESAQIELLDNQHECESSCEIPLNWNLFKIKGEDKKDHAISSATSEKLDMKTISEQSYLFGTSLKIR